MELESEEDNDKGPMGKKREGGRRGGGDGEGLGVLPGGGEFLVCFTANILAFIPLRKRQRRLWIQNITTQWIECMYI